MLLTYHIGVVQRLQIFRTNDVEQRYATIGRFVRCALPPRAVVFATVHSGSIRMYGNRVTVRWEALSHDRLDDTVAMLREAGDAPYFLLEEWEEPAFRRTFSGNAPGQLDWPPSFEYENAHVRMYRVADRARYLAGQYIDTTPMTPQRSGHQCAAADN